MSCRDVVNVDNTINHDGLPKRAHCKSHFIKLIVLAIKSDWTSLVHCKLLYKRLSSSLLRKGGVIMSNRICDFRQKIKKRHYHYRALF